MRVEVRDVCHVVALRLHPERQRKLPEKEFARTGRKRRVENLAVFAVRAIETDLYASSPIPLVLAVVVKGKLIGPAVIGLPSEVADLKDKIRPSIVADDERHVALPTVALGGQ